MKIWMLICPMVVVLSSCNLQDQAPAVKVIPAVPAVPSVPVVTKPPVTIPNKAKNIALVYDGPGACPEDCALAAADTARQAGFIAKIVGPNELTSASTSAQITALFQDVAIWVQPGGHSAQAYQAITPTLRNALISFINDGGGYVGFCAGAFITTKEIGTTGIQGFGIFPGNTAPLGTGSNMEKVSWENKTRDIYFEGGPYIYNIDSSVEVMAVYDDGKTIAAARTTYGKGRVYIAGPHPEAPNWWSSSRDPDGSDRDLAVGMMKWSARYL